jgi:hypothetical protein
MVWPVDILCQQPKVSAAGRPLGRVVATFLIASKLEIAMDKYFRILIIMEYLKGERCY